MTRIRYGDVPALREKYITAQDRVVFKLCGFDEAVVLHMLHRFDEIDTEKTGRLDLAAFYLSFDIEPRNVSPMAKRLFVSFDCDQEGRLTFGQYMVVVYNLALANVKDLLNLTFDIYFKSCSDMNDDVGQRVGGGWVAACFQCGALWVGRAEENGTSRWVGLVGAWVNAPVGSDWGCGVALLLY